MNTYGATVEVRTDGSGHGPPYRITKRWFENREDGLYNCQRGIIINREPTQRDFDQFNITPEPRYYWKLEL